MARPGLQTFTRNDLLFTAICLPSVFLFYVGDKVSNTVSEQQEEDVKSMNSKLIAVTAVLTLFAGMALAQDGAGAPMHHRHGGYMGGMELPLHQLNLTDDQKAQIKQMFQTEKPAMKPLMQQEHAAHTQMIQLITSGTFEQAKVAAVAAQESQIHMQMEIEHAKMASQIYQLLSSDQKAKVADIIAQHQQRMQQRMENKDQAPAEQQ
jgi:Spy/CpxP family protein refolding chaperone